jgi:hypothetical protein
VNGLSAEAAGGICRAQPAFVVAGAQQVRDLARGGGDLPRSGGALVVAGAQ